MCQVEKFLAEYFKNSYVGNELHFSLREKDENVLKILILKFFECMSCSFAEIPARGCRYLWVLSYSSLSNKRAGWNILFKLEIWPNLGILKL